MRSILNAQLQLAARRCSHSSTISVAPVLSRQRQPLAVRRLSTRTTPTHRKKSFAAFAAPATGGSQRGFFSLGDVLTKSRTVPIPRWISPQYYTFTLSEVCGHSSFILVAISYAVDDFLQLRMIAVAGSTVMLFFTYFHPHGRVLWLPFKWNALFIIINSYRIGKIYLDSYMAEQLSPELIQMRDSHFYALDPIDFAKLVKMGKEEILRPGEMLIGQGEMNQYIRLVLDGELSVSRDGQATYDLEEGNFCSECGLHAGLLLPDRVESCCTVTAKTSARTLCWRRNELMDLLAHEKNLRRSLKATLSWDIIRKLKGQRNMLATGAVDDAELWTLKRNEQNNHRYASILHNMLLHPTYLKQRKEELTKYRMIHDIDDEHHKEALQQYGWTVEEFEAGYKEGQEDAVDEEHEVDFIRRNWRWVAHDLYLRVFG